SLIVCRIRGSSSARSRGRLITISLCFRFTELSSTLNFLPAWTTSARPYPVMLLILDAKVYARETLNVQWKAVKAKRARGVEKNPSIHYACVRITGNRSLLQARSSQSTTFSSDVGNY